ncbi:MAG TPA: lytic transglycosylase domain-containing protein [Rhizomicrobium sp.]
MMKLAFLPLISVAVLFAWQGFVTRVQYFSVVATSHPAPIADTIGRLWHRSFGFSPTAPASSGGSRIPAAYRSELQMNASALLNRWNPLIEAAAQRFALPQAWIRTVIKMESGGRTMSSANKPITSHAGAMGLMQVMPGTYREMRAQYRLGTNAYDPHDNVFAGAAYLHWLHQRYGFPAMFAVYNDGPGHFEARRQQGQSLPEETRNYVSRIAATLGAATGLANAGGQERVVKLTRPNGAAVSVAVAAIASVRAAFPGEYGPGVQTVITVGKERQGVRETIAAVDSALKGHGAVIRMAKNSAPQKFHLAAFSHPKRLSVTWAG